MWKNHNFLLLVLTNFCFSSSEYYRKNNWGKKISFMVQKKMQIWLNFFMPIRVSFYLTMLFLFLANQENIPKAQESWTLAGGQPPTLCSLPNTVPWHLANVQESWSLILDCWGGRSLQGSGSLGRSEGRGAPLHLPCSCILCCKWWNCQWKFGMWNSFERLQKS